MNGNLVVFMVTQGRMGSPEAVVRQNGASGTNSLRAQPIIVSSKKVPSHKEAKKALRYKTKSCGIKMHE